MNSLSLDTFTNEPTEVITSSLTSILMPIIIVSIIITGSVVVMWVMSQIQNRKVQNAIIEVRDILKEMNERDKARNAPAHSATPNPQPAPVASASRVEVEQVES